MTFGSFWLIIRLFHDSIESVSSSSGTSIAPTVQYRLNSGMPCHSQSSCHVKIALYATGILASGIAIGYLVSQAVQRRRVRCNTKVKLDCGKVVDTVDVEDVGNKTVYCRCWKSEKFPLCDGSHTSHNKESGDNVGPLIVQNAAKQE